MIIFDNFLSELKYKEYIHHAKTVYKQRCDAGLDPMSFSTRLVDLDNNDPIISAAKSYIEERVKIKLEHCWSQLQVWPVNSFSARHIHDDPRAGKANYTSMLYLNDNFDGGIFHTDTIQIKPVPGRLTLFNGRDIWHGVTMVYDKPRYSVIFWWHVEE